MARSNRPFSRSYRSIWAWVVVAVLVLLRYFSTEPAPLPPTVVDGETYRVRRVVDGDTLLLESGERLRLQGLDAPETVKEDTPVQPWGPEASQFTRDFIEAAEGRVRVTFGPEREDQYGRLLGFVWHGDRLLNEELIREGLARAKLGYRYSGVMKRRFEAAQQEAKRAGRGIWSETDSPAGSRSR